MDRRNSDRYKRTLLEKRGELSIARAEAESPIPAAGHSRAIPSTERMRITKRNFRSTFIKPTCGRSEQSRMRSLGSDMAPSAPVKPVKIQSLEHG